MPDMLVKLYELPDASVETAALRALGVTCRRAESYERSAVVQFASATFPNWTDEVSAGFASVPPSVFVAAEAGAVLGFACYNVTRPNYFGPTGVEASHRGRGIGKVLLLQSLEALRSQGYAYAIIGGVGPAAIIPGSEEAIYGGMLRPRGDAR